jgi:hypothetical protein
MLTVMVPILHMVPRSNRGLASYCVEQMQQRIVQLAQVDASNSVALATLFFQGMVICDLQMLNELQARGESIVTQTTNGNTRRLMVRSALSLITSCFDYNRKPQLTRWYLALLQRLGWNTDSIAIPDEAIKPSASL